MDVESWHRMRLPYKTQTNTKAHTRLETRWEKKCPRGIFPQVLESISPKEDPANVIQISFSHSRF
jgi:hypothetical protein